MRLETDGDSVTLETEREDRELAEAAGDLISGAVGLAESIGVRDCEWCDERGRLRPYQITRDGNFEVIDICADCQADLVEEAMQAAEHDDDRLTTPEDIPEDPPTKRPMPDHDSNFGDLDADELRELADTLDGEMDG